MKVTEILQVGASIYEERNILYGDNYKRHGEMMVALFPEGLKLKNVQDHNRFGILTQIVAKMTRYANNFEAGGHSDSLNDLMVYSAILKELDDDDLP